ncbi:hypothetical protein GQ42DRAFT_165490, partial [Ramicandelaber brevisporus]
IAMPATDSTSQSLAAKMPDWLHIRRAVPDDAAAIVKIMQHTWTHAFAHFVTQAAKDALPGRYAAMVAERRHALEQLAAVPPDQRTEEVFVVVGTPPATVSTPVAGGDRWEDGVHERLLGFAHVWLLTPDTPRIDFVRDEVAGGSPRLAELYTFHFLPEAQGTGAAMAMFARCAQWTRDVLGTLRMILWTVELNTKARAFYERKTHATQLGLLPFDFVGAPVPGVCYSWTTEQIGRFADMA